MRKAILSSSERVDAGTPAPVSGKADAPAELAYRWIRLPKHCALTGDTPYAVHARRRKGVWRDGVQCALGPDGNLYVSPDEWNKWIEGGSQRQFGAQR